MSNGWRKGEREVHAGGIYENGYWRMKEGEEKDGKKSVIK